MTEFFENTWLLWWVVAILIILRWMHVLGTVALDDSEPDFIEPDSHANVDAVASCQQ